MKKQIKFLLLLLPGFMFAQQANDPSTVNTRASKTVVLSNAHNVAGSSIDPSISSTTTLQHANATTVGITIQEDASLKPSSIARTVEQSRVAEKPLVQVVHPSGKEAERTNYKPVVHAKHAAPTPVVHPSGKEAERTNYKRVVHAKHTGPTPVVRPVGKEAQLQPANKR